MVVYKGVWKISHTVYTKGQNMELELKNVGIIKSAHLEFIQGLNLIIGSSSSGKSTLLRAIKSMIDNSFTDSNISYGERKMAIRMVYNGHTATYARDLDSPQRKSAYQIDGKLYTKLGRTSLEDMEKVFKLSPIEIDGEKVNFNFSSQFAGPFLLLGTSSFLYSILTYRSSFDITKINDLYFTDLKKTKQDIHALEKTKEALEKEKETKLSELKPLESFPDVYFSVQKLKQQHDVFQRQSALFNNYKSTQRQIAYRRNKIEGINRAMDAFLLFPERIQKYSLLLAYTKSLKQAQASKGYLHNIALVLDRMENMQPKIRACMTLKAYLKTRGRFLNNKDLLNRLAIPDIKAIQILQQYIRVLDSINKSKGLITKADQHIRDVQDRLSAVNVCPLCNQPICNH